MHRITALILCTFALFLSACGALFNSGPHSVMLTSTPNEADVFLNGNRVGTTPVSVDLKKSTDHTIVFKRAGFADRTVVMNKKISAGFVILDVLGGLNPVVIDAATGSWYTLGPKSVNAVLTQSTAAIDAGAQEMVLRGKLDAGELNRVKAGAPIEQVIPAVALLGTPLPQ